MVLDIGNNLIDKSSQSGGRLNRKAEKAGDLVPIAGVGLVDLDRLTFFVVRHVR